MGGFVPPHMGFSQTRHDFNAECRRGYKYENSQYLEISRIYVNGKCPYPRAKMNGKCPTPRAQKTGKSPTLSRGGPSGIHLILLLPDVEGPAGFLSLFLSSCFLFPTASYIRNHLQALHLLKVFPTNCKPSNIL